MKKIVAGVLLFLLSSSICAEMVMQISLSGELDNVKLSTISKVVFDGNSMIAGNTYNIDAIDKITFYDDNIIPIVKGNKGVQKSGDRVGFVYRGTNLTLSLPKTEAISVRLYAVNGREVARLHDGITKAGTLTLSLDNLRLASGMYSVVVQTPNQLFVRKIINK